MGIFFSILDNYYFYILKQLLFHGTAFIYNLKEQAHQIILMLYTYYCIAYFVDSFTTCDRFSLKKLSCKVKFQLNMC